MSNDVKVLTKKNKELEDELRLKKGERIRLGEELTCLHVVEKKLGNQVEELKADSMKKETRVGHLEGKCQELSSSLEKAKDEAIGAFKTSNEFTRHWTRNMLLATRTFTLMLRKPILRWTLMSSKFQLLLRAFCFRRALRM